MYHIDFLNVLRNALKSVFSQTVVVIVKLSTFNNYFRKQLSVFGTPQTKQAVTTLEI